MRRALGVVLLTVTVLISHTAPAVAGTAACADAVSRSIPPRPDDALTGSAFAASVRHLDGDAREAAIYRELAAGNVPAFLRRLVAVRLSDPETGEAVACVMPDYLAIGSDEDHFLVPMRLSTALRIAQRFRAVLPTRRLVDAIYLQSAASLRPQPLPASDQMRSSAYYQRHNAMVQAQRLALGLPLGALTAGDKKDLVLTNRLWEKRDRVAIYGWHQGDGRPIQPLSTVHGRNYADYSHGVRLVADAVLMNGETRPIADVLADPQSAGLFSDEGVMPQLERLVTLLGATAVTANVSK